MAQQLALTVDHLGLDSELLQVLPRHLYGIINFSRLIALPNDSRLTTSLTTNNLTDLLRPFLNIAALL